MVATALAPAAWFVHINAMPALVPYVCETGATWTLHVTTLLCATVALVGVVACHRLRRAASDADAEDGRRLRTWGTAGEVVAWFFLALTLAEHVPVFFLSACPP